MTFEPLIKTADRDASAIGQVSGTPPVGPIRRRSLHEDLVVMLRQLIVSNELPPGSKVPEKELCERFSVSRTPLREALKVLAIDGLVTLEASRGARVSKITREDLDEVYPVMGALEALAGELASRNITESELRSIRAMHDTLAQHFEARRLTEYFSVNERIHEAILAAAHNKTLTAQYQMLATRVRRARYVATMTDERWQQATREHEEIIRALEARDGPGLAEILKRHLENKLATVCDWLEQQG